MPARRSEASRGAGADRSTSELPGDGSTPTGQSALAFVNAIASLVLRALAAVYYAFPSRV
jgi:hypothetical protein